MTDTEETVDSTAAEPIAAKGPSVACDGGVGALGHPRVFLTFNSNGRVECPYCGRRFVHQPDAH